MSEATSNQKEPAQFGGSSTDVRAAANVQFQIQPDIPDHREDTSPNNVTPNFVSGQAPKGKQPKPSTKQAEAMNIFVSCHSLLIPLEQTVNKISDQGSHRHSDYSSANLLSRGEQHKTTSQTVAAKQPSRIHQSLQSPLPNIISSSKDSKDQSGEGIIGSSASMNSPILPKKDLNTIDVQPPRAFHPDDPRAHHNYTALESSLVNNFIQIENPADQNLPPPVQFAGPHVVDYSQTISSGGPSKMGFKQHPQSTKNINVPRELASRVLSVTTKDTAMGGPYSLATQQRLNGALNRPVTTFGQDQLPLKAPGQPRSKSGVLSRSLQPGAASSNIRTINYEMGNQQQESILQTQTMDEKTPHSRSRSRQKSSQMGQDFLNTRKKKMSVRDGVSPELAARIVKSYILPMFETDQKKELKNKYNKLASIGAGSSKKKDIKGLGHIFQAGFQTSSGQPTVYGELKLSEQLADELQIVREKVKGLQEELEETRYLKEQYYKELQETKAELAMKEKELLAQKREILEVRQHSKQSAIESDQMMRSSKALLNFVATSELYRKRFSEQLRESLSNSDQLSNQIFELQQNKTLTQISFEIVQNKLEMMFESIDSISNAKNLEDKFRFEIDQQKQQISLLVGERSSIEQVLRTIQTQRDQYREDLKETVDKIGRLEKEKINNMAISKAKILELENKKAKLTKDLEVKIDECVKLERTNKKHLDELEKSRQRIVKLKSRKGKADQNQKTCKNCGREYNEAQNVNWSCRMHSLDYSGEMWWCCGKRGREQPGCKFQKHESKDDEDEDDENDKDKNKLKHLKYLRCHCCKELGHTIEECPRDPNLKTKLDPKLELDRIQKIKDFRKLFSDSAVTTTHFLKKCAKVRKVFGADNEGPRGVTEAEAKQMVEKQKTDVFQRGAMCFEDYNYEMYNKYILVDQEGNNISDEEKKEELTPTSSPRNKNQSGHHIAAALGEIKPVHMTENILEQSVSESYQHSQLDIETDQEKEEAAKQLLHEKRLAAQKKFEEEELAREEQEKLLNQEETEEKEEMEFDDENGEEEDEIEYEVFYEHDAIKETYKRQKDDPFFDIIGEKEDSEALKSMNKYNIENFAPPQEVAKAPPTKKGGYYQEYQDSEGPTEEEIQREAERQRKLKEEQRKREQKMREMEKEVHNAEMKSIENDIKAMVEEIKRTGGSHSASKKGSQSSKRSMQSSSRMKR